MATIKLIGDAPNQVSRNRDLGDLAYQDAENIAGDVGVGGALTVVGETFVSKITASTGILFGTDTAAANTLDDYEEGTWTPAVNALTGTFTTTTVASATYTKIGRMVAIQAKIVIDSIGTGADGFQLTSLPFVATPTNAFAIAGKNISSGANFNGYVEVSGSTMLFATTMTNTHTYFINGTYFV